MKSLQKMGRIAAGGLALGGIFSVVGATGPDVIVGDLTGVAHYGAVGGIRAYAVGTTSCNIGDQDLLWIAGNNQHPVIGQSMYRVMDGRIDQLGISWLKHGFTALTQNLCGSCNGHGGSVLGVGCSDPYGSSLNGSQSGLGPRFEVNAYTGVFNYPWSNPNGSTGNAIFKRLQVPQADLDVPSSALFFVEGHYVTQDDAQAGNGANNASYRRVRKNADYSFTLQGTTYRELPGIYAWRDHGLGVNTPDPDVTIDVVNVPNDGRFFVGYKVVDNGDATWTYTYAIHNLDSHRSGAYLEVPIGSAAQTNNVYFHAPHYHSGEPYDNTDWTFTNDGMTARWESPETYSQNPDTNALRWGTMYTFQFTSDGAPQTGTINIGLFRPAAGDPNTVSFAGPVPGDVGPAPVRISIVDEIPATMAPDTPFSFDVSITEGDDTFVPNSQLLHYRMDGGAYVSVPLTFVGGDIWSATVPGAGCTDTPEFYVSAEGVATGVVTAPNDGATNPLSYIVGVPGIAFEDNCETNTGWTVSSTASDGQWDRGVPVGGGTRGDPATDADGSGACWLTDNVAGNSDIDNGETTLTSPLLDCSGPESTISYWRWFSNNFGASPNEDVMVVEINNGDGNWVELETVGPSSAESGGGWFNPEFRVADFVTPTATTQIRFIAGDTGNASVVEAGVDGIVVGTFGCSNPCVADWNEDGDLNFFDILQFLEDFNNQLPEADLNNDGEFNFFDMLDFLGLFDAGC
ncbi:MAG: hypothetical protein D6695_00180 [Planctomycetota bacterium]|nr:MAG: hypothetical protein D6695_00180 [Planctomycetota bacterium]